MFAVFKRIFKDKYKGLIIYVIAAAGFVEMYLALFPTLKQQAEQLNKLLEAYPKSLMSAFGFEGTGIFFSRVENYMATEFFSVFWPILAVIMLISFAGAALTNEIENGTIELTLAQPLSRTKIFISRYLAGAVYFAIFSGLSIFSIVLFSALHKFDFQLNNYFSIWLVAYLFGMAIFSLAYLFAALSSEKGRAVFMTAGIILAMYFLNIIAGLKDSLSNLKYYSFFHYMNAPQVLGKNHFVDNTFWVFGGTIVFATLLAMYVFNRRDITT